MKKKVLFIILVLYMSMGKSHAFPYPQNNREPLLPKKYMELPLGSVKPSGWMEDQLERMKNGMTGHLDEMYSHVMGDRNAWLGGDGDAWERGPYWIDGLLPLAYILDDVELIRKASKWVEAALASQQTSGYFGPSQDRSPERGLQRNNSHDWWPKMVMLKVMQQYYSATGDERVISFLTKYFKYQLSVLPEKPLDNWTYWGKQRGGDNLMVVYWLYNITGEKFLLDLAELIHAQTYDWTNAFLYEKTVSIPFSHHCVNLAQGIKEPAIYYQQSGEQKYLDAVSQVFKDIRKYIGWPTGLYGGDELLHGANPTQGSELCTAVEMMFSLEKIIEITGDVKYVDLLERIAYNALPTQITDDFNARQYYQQCNQISISYQNRNFITQYNGTDQLMGLLTGYPCCTSNLHQGWPKFVKHLIMASDDNGIAALAYAPCEASVTLPSGDEISIVENTFYPFDYKVQFSIAVKKRKSVSFPFHLRIPAWCGKAKVMLNGVEYGEYEGGRIIVLDRKWNNGDSIELLLPMKVSVGRWYERSAAIERGPLVYALKLQEKWNLIKNDEIFGSQYGDEFYEVVTHSAWNYALPDQNIREERIDDAFKVVINTDKYLTYPWNLENAPVEIRTKGRVLYDWKEYNGSAGPLPYSIQPSHKAGPEEDIILVPYGCTTLRITEFPLVKSK